MSVRAHRDVIVYLVSCKRVAICSRVAQCAGVRVQRQTLECVNTYIHVFVLSAFVSAHGFWIFDQSPVTQITRTYKNK